VVYPRGSETPSSWGFTSETRTEQHGDDRIYCDWFKRLLDPNVLRQAQAKDPQNSPRSQAEVDKWFEDYMRLLYRHVESKIVAELPSSMTWNTTQIEFIFSVPTTWSTHPTVERFKRLVQQAGWGTYPTHCVSIGLTEAEAAAVATSIEAPGLFHENDVMMVCDAGGGTTDLSVLMVTGTADGALSLQQMDEVFGRNIGSTAIDTDFEDLALVRLNLANQVSSLGIDIDSAAWEMMKSREFQDAKCDYGSPDDTPVFSVPVPKLHPACVNRQFGLVNGCMTFTRQDLQNLFDKQIQALQNLVEEQLKRFETKFPLSQISHLVLSGGLGNSPYVQTQLKVKFGIGVNRFACASNLRIQIAPEPQLVVCRGLVLDRKAKLERGRAVLGWRCCRASYGTIAKIKYDKKNPDHFGKPQTQDPKDGKWYINDGIVWFIKKGEPVNVDVPEIRRFRRKITPGDPRRAFTDSVVTSELDKDYLPIHMTADVRKLCNVTSDLSGVEDTKFKKKNRHWWSFRTPYLRADYQIKVLIGPADITFQLWFDGQQLSRDNPITVDWQPSAPPTFTNLSGEPPAYFGHAYHANHANFNNYMHQAWQNGV